MQNQFETAVTAIVVVKPEANAPDKDDIIDLCVKIVLVCLRSGLEERIWADQSLFGRMLSLA